MSSAPSRRRPPSLRVAGASAASSLLAALRSEEPGSGLSPPGQVGQGVGKTLALFLGLVINSVRRLLTPSPTLAGNAPNHASDKAQRI